MFAGTNVQNILRALQVAETKYNRLVLVVAESGSGKTESILAVSEQAGAQYVNVNLELSERLLSLTQSQRQLRAAEILSELVSESAKKTDAQIVALDNIEITFDVSLKLDPLACLQQFSKNTTLIASWNGSIENSNLTYARSGHPEYRKYDVRDLLIVELGSARE